MAPSRNRGRSTITHHLLPFGASITPLQAATYLLGISLFSISFLVFLNSAISFVITDLLGVKTGVGDIVGTLGFVDEVVALIACPAWGLLSDRLGVRWVSVLGYTIIALSLWAFVQVPGGAGEKGYPGLVAARIVFALGATAAATMVTATLPVLTADGDEDGNEADTMDTEDEDEDERRRKQDARRSIAISLESDMTITPERFTRSISSDERRRDSNASFENDSYSNKGRKPSTLAGYVGLFTGCGALVALTLFLPLPTQFSRKEGVTPARAITDSFYVVAAVALLVAVFVFFGLRGLRGEENKGWRTLLGLRTGSQDENRTSSAAAAALATEEEDPAYPSTIGYTEQPAVLPYRRLLLTSLRLGTTDPDIALGYLGGFVARASTVAISLFVPLYVNAYFISNGFCQGSPNDPSPELKKECRAAYVLASMLSGVAQLVALLCAPVFGWVSANAAPARRGDGDRDRGERGGWWTRVNWGLAVATAFGIVGYMVFPHLKSPEYKNVDGRGGSAGVFLVVAMLGVSQIGAIVCSLGSLGRGVVAGGGWGEGEDEEVGEEDRDQEDRGETQALLESNINNGGGGDRNDNDSSSSNTSRTTRIRKEKISRVQLKGSIAGVYSWCGGAAILLLTKLGGYLFDVASRGAPFYMMAAFNAVLLLASLGIDLGRGFGGGQRRG
ncbi:hypothetical protein F5X96DRAFT_628165 [Biscogniauxia mediterranea]|nr:hypothetical protein F5X96DRAFT_628165 [Biscogniauxia mediterranea]